MGLLVNEVRSDSMERLLRLREICGCSDEEIVATATRLLKVATKSLKRRGLPLPAASTPISFLNELLKVGLDLGEANPELVADGDRALTRLH